MMQDEVSEVYVRSNTLIDPSLKNIDDVDTLCGDADFQKRRLRAH